MMAYFTPDFLNFFIELAANNNRDWFNANKKRYEQSVKLPFQKFVGDLLEKVRQDDPQVIIPASQAIFRINRDVRFSNDKSPYKIHASAFVVPGLRRSIQAPGLYIETSPEHFSIYGGLYEPDKNQLQAVRETIAAAPDQINKLIAAPAFQELFGEILGDQNVRLPKQFQAVRTVQPLIANKQFYFRAQLPPETLLSPQLLDLVYRYYLAAKPLNQYLHKAAVFGA